MQRQLRSSHLSTCDFCFEVKNVSRTTRVTDNIKQCNLATRVAHGTMNKKEMTYPQNGETSIIVGSAIF